MKSPFATHNPGNSILPSLYITEELEYLYLIVSFASTREIFFEIDQIKETCGMARIDFERLCVPKDTNLDEKVAGEDVSYFLMIECYPYVEYMLIGSPKDDYKINKTIYL